MTAFDGYWWAFVAVGVSTQLYYFHWKDARFKAMSVEMWAAHDSGDRALLHKLFRKYGLKK